MRVLLDTNILLDLFLDREPFAEDAATLWQANAEGRIVAYVSAITPVNLFYVARKLRNQEVAWQAVTELLSAFLICPLNHATLQTALNLSFTDYEDAVQYACAINSGLTMIITRNVKDFSAASLPVLTPADFLKQIDIAQ